MEQFMRSLMDSLRIIGWNNLILEKLGGNEEKAQMYHRLEVIIKNELFGHKSQEQFDESLDLVLEACRNAQELKDIDIEALKMKLRGNKI